MDEDFLNSNSKSSIERFNSAVKRIKNEFNSVSEKLPADLDSIKRCYIRRNGLGKIFKEPYLNEYLKGMFVKISTGTDTNGQNKYSLVQIEEVKKYPKKYRFFDGMTDKTLLLRKGSRINNCRFDLLSNSSISVKEFEKWQKSFDVLEKEKNEWAKIKIAEKSKDELIYDEDHFFDSLAIEWLKLSKIPAKSDLISRADKANYLRNNYVYTNKDLKEMEKNALEGPVKNVGNVTRELIKLKNKIDIATANKNKKALVELTKRQNKLKNFNYRRNFNLTKTREKQEKTEIKTLQKFENLQFLNTAESNKDAFKRTETRSLVQRFGAENQKKEFEKMEKKINSLRTLRSESLASKNLAEKIDKNLNFGNGNFSYSYLNFIRGIKSEIIRNDFDNKYEKNKENSENCQKIDRICQKIVNLQNSEKKVQKLTKNDQKLIKNDQNLEKNYLNFTINDKKDEIGQFLSFIADEIDDAKINEAAKIALNPPMESQKTECDECGRIFGEIDERYFKTMLDGIN